MIEIEPASSTPIHFPFLLIFPANRYLRSQLRISIQSRRCRNLSFSAIQTDRRLASMAAAAISHLRRGAQRHALLCLARRRFASSAMSAAASPLSAAALRRFSSPTSADAPALLVSAARRLLSTTTDSGTSPSGDQYKPPPFDPFRAATLSPSAPAPPLESPPLEDPPSTPPPPEEAPASEAAHQQATLACQEVELEGLKAGVEAVRSREESPEEKEAWWLLSRAIVNYCGSPVGTVAANDPSSSQMLNYDQVFIRDFVPSAIAFLLKGENEIVKNFLLHTLQLQVSS